MPTASTSTDATTVDITPIIIRKLRVKKSVDQDEIIKSTSRKKLDGLWLYPEQAIPYEHVTEHGKVFYIEDVDQAIGILDHWTANKYWIALDCETGCGWRFDENNNKTHFYTDGKVNKIYGSDPWTSPLYLIQASVKSGEAVVFDTRKLLKSTDFIASARRCFQECRIVGHNLLFDASFLTVKLNCKVNSQFDTAIAYQMVNAGLVETVALKSVLKVFKNIDLSKDWQTQFLSLHPTSPIPIEAIDYAACDVFWLLDIAKELYKQLIERELISVWENIERPLMPWILNSMLRGVRVNPDPLNELDLSIQRKITADKEILFNNLGDINYRSNLQLSKWYEEFGIDLPRTATGNLSMTGANLKKAVATTTDPKIIEVTTALLEIKKLEKTSGTYLRPLAGRFQNPITGKVHPYWRQNPTQTGRMSCAEPSLMNIPLDNMREAFQADDDYAIITADYSQVEVRILAEVSAEQIMLDVFIEAYELTNKIKDYCSARDLSEVSVKKIFEGAVTGKEEASRQWQQLSVAEPALKIMLEKLPTLDFHSRTAALLFHNGDFTKVTKEERSKAKSGTFGVIYGQREYGLSEKMGVSIEQAKEFLDQYFSTFKRVAQWLNDMKINAQNAGYTTTLSGRKRFYLISNLQDLCKKFYSIKNDAASQKRWEQLCRTWETDDVTTLARKVSSFQWKQAGRQGTNHPIQGLSADITKLATIIAGPNLRLLHPDCYILMWIHDEVVSTAPNTLAKKASVIQVESMIKAAEFYLSRCPIEVGVTLSDRWSK